MNLTRATIEDADQIAKMVGYYHAYQDITLDEDARKQAILPLLQSDSAYGAIYKIEEASVAIGYIAICYGYSIEFGGREAFVDELWVDASYRGSGIGTEVMSELKARLEDQGFKALHLMVSKMNHPAQRLYAKLGFELDINYLNLSLTLST